jgi:25S rRNA (uracil2634-N3)-methyltransferase
MPKLKKSLLSSQREPKKTPYSEPKKAVPQKIPKLQNCFPNLIPDILSPPTLLLVGEGNFSFALSLCRLLQRGDTILATSLDTESVVLEKYPDSKEILEEIKEWGATVEFDIDACKLSSYRTITKHKFEVYRGEPIPTKKSQFDAIIFMFPHVGAGIKDQARNVLANQNMISSFFASATSFLAPKGRIVVTTKEGMPYTLWEIKSLAKQHGLKCMLSLKFRPQEFPDYTHRRTLGFKEGVSSDGNQEVQNSRMYFFIK